jgi:methyl-accepting chemotaxis protein
MTIGASVYTYFTIKSLDKADTALYEAASDATGLSMFATAQWKLVMDIHRLANERSGQNAVQKDTNLYNSMYADFDKMGKVIDEYVTTDAEARKNALARFEQLSNSRKIIYDMVFIFAENGYGTAERRAVRNWVDQTILPAIEATGAEVERLRVRSDNQLVTTTDRFIVAGRTTLTIYVLILIVFIGIAVAARVMLLDKLDQLAKAFHEVTSGDGDLRKSINLKTKDELGALAGYFDKFTDQVADIVRKVQSSANDTNMASTSMAATMEQLSATFENQNIQVATVASAMEEMSSSAMEISATLASNKEYVDEAAKYSDNGARQLELALNSINEISAKTEQLASTIGNLSTSSIQIGEILNTINDIAGQTNLLALNAAIEAARAGDAGRGFAVVADEVRKLAERTQRATQEIETIITTLQRESATAAKEMTEAGASVKSGVENLQQTQQAMDNIVASIDGVKANAEQIGAAVSQQSSAIAGVNDNAQAMASGIEECSNVVSEVSHSTADLQNQSENTSKILSFFKV